MATRRDESRSRLGDVLSATAIGIAGLFAIVAWQTVLVSLFDVDLTQATTTAVVVSSAAGGLGTASVAALFLLGRNLDASYLDVPRPRTRDIGYVVGGTVGLLTLNVALSWTFSRLGMETARHGLLARAESNPEILLVLIPLAYLFIGPGEELLYRNVVQKSLYDSFSPHAAVLVASAIFAAAHVTSYLDPGDPLATLNGLLTVFALSVVLGAVYLRTRSLVVVSLIHASFDAAAFAITYVQLT